MSRRKLLMGNWKMFKTVAEARTFAEQFGSKASELSPEIDYAVCAPFTSFHVLRVTMPVSVKIGAQNVHFEEQGAFTGEISPAMLEDLGITYVLAGHSERRSIFGETDDIVRKKVNAIVKHGMTPVLCVGEDLGQRERGETMHVVETQTLNGLSDLSAEQVAASVIAYEPIWAIGTGRTATAEDAESVIRGIREVIAKDKGEEAATQVRILYGGSVKPENVAGFTAQPNIDGGLVGGASLEANSFYAMAKAIEAGA